MTRIETSHRVLGCSQSKRERRSPAPWVRNSNFEELLEHAKNSSSDALGEILDSIRSYLKMVADVALKERFVDHQCSSDMVQIAQMEVSRQITCFRGQTYLQFCAWVRQILLNKIIDAQRAEVRRSLCLDKFDPTIWGSMIRTAGNSANDDPSPSSICVRNEQELLVLSLLQTLAPHYQEVLKRRHFEGESFEVIAADWNCTTDSVRKTWTRAIGKLQIKVRPNL
ncbi:MAG: sigma-70 family RNA polymerase sigma factor [Planctomycetaceae bacterium]|nr:sigma-70 family RNA polymerase sigma factor [Planctomycetaceae bacterium]